MNDVIKAGPGMGLAARTSFLSNIEKANMALPVRGGDYQFLKIDQTDGAWLYGQESTEVDPDDLWIVDVRSFQHGYIAWHMSSVEGEVLIPIGRELPSRDMLSPVKAKNGWEDQRGVNMVCISGEDKGVNALYKASSAGAMTFFADLTSALLAQGATGAEALFPVVRLRSKNYKSKKNANKIVWNPLFEVVEWRELYDTAAASGGTKAPAAAVDDDTTDEDDEAELAAQYAAEEAKKAAAATPVEATPRRRLRRE